MKINATALSISSLFLLLVLGLCAAPGVDASGTVSSGPVYSKSSVTGTITCNSGVQLGPSASAVGTINVVADGNGNLTSGTASYSANSGIACYYTLISGTYTVQSNGTGQATTNWSLASHGSSPNCAPTVSQSGITFSLANSTFVSPTAAGRSENGNCTLATVR